MRSALLLCNSQCTESHSCGGECWGTPWRRKRIAEIFSSRVRYFTVVAEFPLNNVICWDACEDDVQLSKISNLLEDRQHSERVSEQQFSSMNRRYLSSRSIRDSSVYYMDFVHLLWSRVQQESGEEELSPTEFDRPDPEHLRGTWCT